MKNIEFINSIVRTRTFNFRLKRLCIRQDGFLGNPSDGEKDLVYDEVNNQIKQGDYYWLEVAQVTASSTSPYAITSLTPKTVFHAADYNDINNIPHIVETYNNGTSWYRVYSDGWCEQGGITGTGVVSINLLVNFIDLNYIVLANVLSDDTQQAYSNQVNIKTKTTNSFIFAAASTRIRQWRACGYIS